MAHPPFDAWIFDTPPQTEVDKRSLQQHLSDCPECRQAYQQWAAVQHQLMVAPMRSPAPGFTQRWQARAAVQIARQQVRQVRRFFLILIGLMLLAAVLLVVYTETRSSPADWLVAGLGSLTQAIILLQQARAIFASILRALPPFIPVTFWILVTTGVSLLSMAWAVTLWKLSAQGAHKS